METQALLVILLVMVALLGAIVIWLAYSVRSGQEARHRSMLNDLHEGLNASADRIGSRQGEEGERLRRAVGEELERNRNQLQSFEKVLAEKVDARLNEIGGKVNERLDEGFKRTNDTFISVMTRLQTIDDAQKKIETLTGSVVSLQQLMDSKSARGALGERQLEDIVRNMLPETVFEFQYTFQTTGVRADCVLKLPAPTGLIAIDSKFPLENYRRLYSEADGRETPGAFRADVRRHVDAIASKYIVPGETGDSAVMFVPAESVFAEIHGNHRDLVEYAALRRVWIASPTTLMAVLNTARAVLKDVETRKQIHIIQEELAKLGADFSRFQSRMDNLARHIQQAKNDVDEVQTSSRKITERFAKIERAELDAPAGKPPALTLVKPESQDSDG